jgi:FkbM family methyltransferase
MSALVLSFRQRLSFAAHVFKALLKQHHAELLPILGPLVASDAVVVDAGAHAGQFTKLFAALAPEGKVFAFEPGSYAGAILRRVVRWHGLAQVEVIRSGLSDREGDGELVLPIKPSGSLGFGLAHVQRAPAAAESTDETKTLRRERIKLTTLDRFAEARALIRLDFLKADVEGFEARLLTGGMATIARFRPAILLEVVGAHLARADDAPGDIWRLLAPLGYRSFRMRLPKPVPSPFSGDGDYLFLAAKNDASVDQEQNIKQAKRWS